MSEDNGKNGAVEYVPQGSGGPVVPVANSIKLLPKSLQEIDDSTAFRKEVYTRMTRGAYGSGAHYGFCDGIDNMCFKEGFEFLQDCWNLCTGKPVITTNNHKVIVGDVEVIHITVIMEVPIINTINTSTVGVGIGACSTMETKNRYYGELRKCPECNASTLYESKKDNGWFCWKKKGGCGKSFTASDSRITSQPVGKAENTNPIDKFNTVLQMAKKRAIGPAILGLTGMSRYLVAELPDTGTHNANLNAEQNGNYGAPPKKANGKHGEGNGGGQVTQEMQSQLNALLLEKFGNVHEVEKWLAENTYGRKSAFEVTSKGQYDYIMGAIK
ncbi:MAG: hypothetical protein GY757_10005 [bacterium]|nr:hypothetical protein [bacterium]